MRPDSEFLLGFVSGKLAILRKHIDEYCSDEQWVTQETHDALLEIVDNIQGMVRRIIDLESSTVKCDFCGEEIRKPTIYDRGDPTGVVFINPDGSVTRACAKCMIRQGMVKDDEEEDMEVIEE